MGASEEYIRLIEAEKTTIAAGSAQVLNVRRDEAIAALKAHGLPERKDERYLYTDVEAALAPNYGINLRRRPLEYTLAEGWRKGTVRMVNDQVDESEGQSGMWHGGVFAGSVGAAEREEEVKPERYVDCLRNAEGDGITALGTALAQEGLFVYAQKGTNTDKPLEVDVLTAGRDIMVPRRMVVAVEDGARLKLTLRETSGDRARLLSVSVSEIYVGKGAVLELNMLSETGRGHTLFDNIYVEQEEGSRMEVTSLTLRSGVTRRLIDHRFAGKGAELKLKGVVMEEAEERVDQNLRVEHSVGDCQSDILYKYVLDGQSVGAMAGKVYVAEGAEGTVSALRNNNLVVSEGARMYSQPTLEIYADDVKCSHGSTVGQPDEDALFYMYQRGIDRATARKLLKQAFLSEVIGQLPLSPLKRHVCDLCNLCY